MSEQEMARVRVKIPDFLLESFDKEITPIYHNRNNAIKNSMIRMMHDAKKLKKDIRYRRIRDDRFGER